MKQLKKLKPVDTLSLVDKVELSLLEFFKVNEMGPGDPIPKELDFAESFGVSRTVVREDPWTYRIQKTSGHDIETARHYQQFRTNHGSYPIGYGNLKKPIRTTFDPGNGNGGFSIRAQNRQGH